MLSLGPGFLQCQLAPACATGTWWEHLSTISSLSHSFHQMGFSTLVPVAGSGAESSGQVGSYSWELTTLGWNKPCVQPCGSKLSLLWTRRQNGYHYPNWVDKQRPEGWEAMSLASTLGTGWVMEAARSSKEALSVEISLQVGPPGYFWSFHTNCDSVLACYFSSWSPSENQQQCTRHADLRLPAAHLCCPLTPLLARYLHASIYSSGLTLLTPWHSTGPQVTQVT